MNLRLKRNAEFFLQKYRDNISKSVLGSNEPRSDSVKVRPFFRQGRTFVGPWQNNTFSYTISIKKIKQFENCIGRINPHVFGNFFLVKSRRGINYNMQFFSNSTVFFHSFLRLASIAKNR